MSSEADSGGASAAAAVAFRMYRSLVESSDRKFARVRDLPTHGRGPHLLHYHRKVFRAYTRLWRFQQERRSELVAAGLCRWEIGEIASRIGQLYYSQYLRTSEARFLLESYVFYEAILSRGYFKSARGDSSPAKPEAALRFKELRFLARFLIVAMLLNRAEVVKSLADRLGTLIEESKTTFPGTNFKEWKQVLQEIIRFLDADKALVHNKPLRYNILFDTHPSSLPHIARFQAKARRVLTLRDAVITSHRRNEVKFTELTLDTFRMLQCLEWEPSGSFYHVSSCESCENGTCSDPSVASGLIDINLAADMTDPSLPPNPRKAILYHPTVPHLIAVLAMICEELLSDSILLIYISASGSGGQNAGFRRDFCGPSNSVRQNSSSQAFHNLDGSLQHPPVSDDSDSSDCSGNCLCLSSRGNEGLSSLYPDDLIPFTRSPLFVIIDSENSRAFKAGY